MDDDNEVKKYGVRAATINLWKKDADTQWSIWYGQLSSSSYHFESMCEPFCICCECGVILCVMLNIDRRNLPIGPQSFPTA